jgi:hypothetical protein
MCLPLLLCSLAAVKTHLFTKPLLSNECCIAAASWLLPSSESTRHILNFDTRCSSFYIMLITTMFYSHLKTWILGEKDTLFITFCL